MSATIVYLIIYFLYAGAMYRLFQKAGIKYPWFAFIPVCSTIGMLWVIGKSGWNIFWQLVPVVNVIFAIIWGIRFVQAYGKSGWWMLWAVLPLSDIIFAIMFLIWGYGSKTQYVGVPTDPAAAARRKATMGRIGKALREASKDDDFDPPDFSPPDFN